MPPRASRSWARAAGAVSRAPGAAGIQRSGDGRRDRRCRRDPVRQGHAGSSEEPRRYDGAFNYIQVEPWRTPLPRGSWLVAARWSLSAIGAIPVVLSLTLVRSCWRSWATRFPRHARPLYYIPVHPGAAVLAMAFAVDMPVRSRAESRDRRGVPGRGRAIVPARLAFAATLHRLPRVSRVVDAISRDRRRPEAVSAIRTEFVLQPSTESRVLYRILGGRIDPAAPARHSFGRMVRVPYVEGGT